MLVRKLSLLFWAELKKKFFAFNEPSRTNILKRNEATFESGKIDSSPLLSSPLLSSLSPLLSSPLLRETSNANINRREWPPQGTHHTVSLRSNEDTVLSYERIFVLTFRRDYDNITIWGGFECELSEVKRLNVTDAVRPVMKRAVSINVAWVIAVMTTSFWLARSTHTTPWQQTVNHCDFKACVRYIYFCCTINTCDFWSFTF